MIYSTEYNNETKQCVASSVDSGFETIDQVQIALPYCKLITPRVLLCDDVVFSDFIFHIDESGIKD